MVVLSLAAIASLILTAIIGVPVLATRLTPLIPLPFEQKLGEAIDKQVRPLLDTSTSARVSSAAPARRGAGARRARQAGRPIGDGGDGPYPARVDVVRRTQATPLRCPAATSTCSKGYRRKANPDELAGVLAHEMGHVAHRDGTRTVLQTAGLSFLFGMMLGDFVGGGAVVIAAKTVLRSSYSRRVEAAADTYSVGLMQKAGGDPHALATILAAHRLPTRSRA